MMRLLILFLVPIVFSLEGGAQRLRDQLQGTWICLARTDSSDHPIIDQPTSIYGIIFNRSRFLSFNAPFNSPYFSYDYVVEEDPQQIKVFPRSGGTFDRSGNPLANEPPPQLPLMYLFTIKEISAEHLTLDLKTDYSGITRYRFKRKEAVIKEVGHATALVENKYLVIKDLSPLTQYAEYLFGNTTIHHHQPIYKGDFGDYLAERVKLGKNFPLDSLSAEVIVQFTINTSGTPQQIKIIQGLNEKADASIIKAIAKTKGKWTPLVRDAQYLQATMQFHLLFYKNKGSLF